MTAAPPAQSDAGSSWPSTILALAVLATSATQLRPRQLLVGPGELILAGATTAILMAVARRGAARLWCGLGVIGFWLVALGALAAGWAWSLVNAVPAESAGRDAMTYLACALFAVTLTVQPFGPRLLTDAVPKLAAGAGLGFGGLLVAALLRGPVGPADVWYDGVRFRAWAENPNQLALFLVPLPFLLLERVAPGGVPWRRLALAAVVTALGLATGSDALRFAWAVGWIVVAAGLAVGLARRQVRSRIGTFAGKVVVPAALVVIATVGAPVIWEAGEVALMAALEPGGQGAERVARWSNGFEAVVQSPLVGFGPGSYSGPTRPFQGHEAHSTPIDWAASTGAVGLLALALLVSSALGRCLRTGAFFGAAGLLVLVVYGGLHYVLRQPVTWLFLVAVIAMGTARVAGTRPQRRDPAR